TIISVVLTVLILAGGFGISSMLTDQKEPAPRIQVSKRIPQVRFLEVDNGNMPTRVYITGRHISVVDFQEAYLRNALADLNPWGRFFLAG
ncbi:MAG: hypothetical protein AAF804_06730, partial [Bacteroidota bacterium]